MNRTATALGLMLAAALLVAAPTWARSGDDPFADADDPFADADDPFAEYDSMATEAENSTAPQDDDPDFEWGADEDSGGSDDSGTGSDAQSGDDGNDVPATGIVVLVAAVGAAAVLVRRRD